MLNLTTIMISSQDPAKLTDFYTKLLGEPAWTGNEFRGWKAGTGYLMIGPHDQITGTNQEPARLISNFETDDVEGEFGRVTALGAKVIAEPYHPGEDPAMLLATLADPDGNYFQLASPMPS